MRYYSTRDKERKAAASLCEAAFAGLAPDGGLYMPERIPQVDMEMVHKLADKSYADMAAYVAGLIFDEIPQQKINALVKDAYNFAPVLHSFETKDQKDGKELHTLELFHGPTLAFKDFGALFMGRMLGLLAQEDIKGEDIKGEEKESKKEGKEKDTEEIHSHQTLTVLTATSGDTGSAVANGFYNVEGVNVIVLFPDGKVSPLQQAQMTTLGGNINPIRVRGTFDDCQRMVKDVFNDVALRKEIRVTSANSINILRWIPQAFYYFYGYHLWSKKTGSKEKEPVIVVPSGNYGNIAAGMLAYRMGLPVKEFVAASNDNDQVPRYLDGEEYQPGPSIQTLANAMDVGAPSNFERMLYLCDNDPDRLRSLVKGYSVKGKGIKKAVREIYDRFGYLSCPHSAIGYEAADKLGIDGFWLSTAHGAKFMEVIQDACDGAVPQLPSQLAKAMAKEQHSICMEADSEALKALLPNR